MGHNRIPGISSAVAKAAGDISRLLGYKDATARAAARSGNGKGRRKSKRA
jgi:hypothetical protein